MDGEQQPQPSPHGGVEGMYREASARFNYAEAIEEGRAVTGMERLAATKDAITQLQMLESWHVRHGVMDRARVVREIIKGLLDEFQRLLEAAKGQDDGQGR